MVLNKRGQGLSVNAIILIVLGVVVLAVLIFGFTVGFGKILPFISSDNNVKTVVTACSAACVTNSVYDFCTQSRELKAGDLKEGGVEKKSVSGSCYALSENTDLDGYGISKCPTITSCKDENKELTFNK